MQNVKKINFYYSSQKFPKITNFSYRQFFRTDCSLNINTSFRRILVIYIRFILASLASSFLVIAIYPHVPPGKGERGAGERASIGVYACDTFIPT